MRASSSWVGGSSSSSRVGGSGSRQRSVSVPSDGQQHDDMRVDGAAGSRLPSHAGFAECVHRLPHRQRGNRRKRRAFVALSGRVSTAEGTRNLDPAESQRRVRRFLPAGRIVCIDGCVKPWRESVVTVGARRGNVAAVGTGEHRVRCTCAAAAVAQGIIIGDLRDLAGSSVVTGRTHANGFMTTIHTLCAHPLPIGFAFAYSSRWLLWLQPPLGRQRHGCTQTLSLTVSAPGRRSPCPAPLTGPPSHARDLTRLACTNNNDTGHKAPYARCHATMRLFYHLYV